MIESRITLVESAGWWPATFAEDIVGARDKLVELGHGVLVMAQLLGKGVPVDMRVSSSLYEVLNQNISNTRISYREFLEKNNIATVICDDIVDADIVLVSFENDTIQINGVQSSPSMRIDEK